VPAAQFRDEQGGVQIARCFACRYKDLPPHFSSVANGTLPAATIRIVTDVGR
jgi:hypothetical protein